MALFHRLSVPTYFGGLPGSYDYVNNAISGTPAFADGAKGSGPNAGSYFIAFGEDATSSDANRPAQALAQNCDFLDDTLHRDVALPVATTTQTAGGSISTIVLTGPGVFMGLAGATLAQLFQITDGNDEDIDDGGTLVVVTAAVDSGAVTVGGGFSLGNVTLTLNTPITIGQTYRVWYAERTNFATFPADGLTTTHLRNLTAIDAGVEELFRTLHGNGQAWNAAWESTVYDLVTLGLSGIYSLSTTGSGTPNTPGAGAVATRTARALTMQSAMNTRAMPDPYNLLWEANALGDAAATSSAATGTIGSLGFGAITARWGVKGETVPSPMPASHASFLVRSQPLADPGTGMGYWTRVPSTASATVTNFVSAGVYKVVLDSISESYFWKQDSGTSGSPRRTAMALGYDYLLLTLSSGQVLVRVLYFDPTELSTLTKGKTCYVTAFDGGEIVGLPGSATAVSWVTASFLVSHGAASAKALFGSGNAGGFFDDGIFAVIPPPTVDKNTSDATFAGYTGPTAAQHYLGRDTTDLDGNAVLGWGAFNQRDISGDGGGTWQTLGQLNSDGGMSVGYVRKPLVNAVTGVDGEVRGNYITLFGGGAQTVSLDVDHFDLFWVILEVANTVLTVNFSSVQAPSNPIQPGKHLRVIVVQAAAGCSISNSSALAGFDYPIPYGIFNIPPLQGVAATVDVYDIDAPAFSARNTARVTRY